MKKSLLICLFSVSAVTWLGAQGNRIDTLLSRFEEYRTKTLTEKIYAHIDQSFHLTGETLWFKIYTVDGSFHKPLDMSKVAYAEILNSAGTPVLQAKIRLKNGQGSGSFFLPASLTTGNYKLSVYTNWMKNFPSEYYYSKVISIVNPFLTPDRPPTKTPVSCSIDFFPEGGNLLSEIESKVAFRVSEPSGKFGLCGGVIQNEQGETVTLFSPDKSGMGHFILKPRDGHQYRAVIFGASGRQQIHPLPEAQTSGYAMQLRDSGDFVTITVRTRAVQDDHVYLFAHARQIIAHASLQPLRNNKAAFVLRRKDLHEGISHLTLFNQELQPVCERLYFIHPEKELNIQVSASQKTLMPRRKVSVSIATNDGEKSPVRANMSMSVYRIDSLSSGTSANIYSYLWLGSDLPGYAESAGYYFEDSGEEANSQVDNLLLTHGWRRFDWKNILEKKSSFPFLPEVREHIVSAIVLKDQQMQRGVFTYLGSPGKIIRAYGAWSNTDGVARFEIKDFYGPRRIILQTATDSAEQYEIKIMEPFSAQRGNERVPSLQIHNGMKDALKSRSIAMQVQDIYYYEDHGTRVEQPVVDSAAFYGKADATYLLDDYTRFPLMEEVMREYVPGVFVRKRKDGFHFIVVDNVHGGLLPGDPIVLLDGVPVPDVDDIMRIDPLRVRKLEVVKRPYYLGQAAFSGIVSYTTYNGDLGGLELDPRSISLDYDGLQMKRVFHKPRYTPEQLHDRLPDQRFLLHWEPEIITDANGKHQLEFYTSDVPGQYIIVVEGISDTGLSGTATYTFTVQPRESQ